MLSERQSFLVSLATHLGVLVVLLVVGAIVARRTLGPDPIQVELLSPVPAAPKHSGERVQPKPPEPEPEPEIIERQREDPPFDPDRSINPDEIPDVEIPPALQKLIDTVPMTKREIIVLKGIFDPNISASADRPEEWDYKAWLAVLLTYRETCEALGVHDPDT